MRKTLIQIILLFFFCSFTFAQQVVDTIFYNKDWQKTNSSNFEYYGIAKKTDVGYIVVNFYKNGKIQMEATYLSLEPSIKDGICTWYNKDGKIKERVNYSKYKTAESDYFEQETKLKKATEFSFKNNSIDSLQHFINSNRITDTGLYALAYTNKAMVLKKIHKDKIRNFVKGDVSGAKVVNEILECYRIAMDTNVVCKLNSQVNRMRFLRRINDTIKTYKNDLKELRLNGFKDDFRSFDVGLNFMKGVHNWIGVDVSLVTFNGEQWKPKVKSSDLKESIIPSSFPVKMGFLNVSYLSNISTKDYDLSFSLFQFTSPIVFNVTKFGFHKSVIADQKYWYYRPEIGIGWNCFSIYYSYNIAFQNTAASFAERHLVNLRIAIPIAKF